MTKMSKAQLLATSAIAGFSVLQFAPAAQAQDAFGIHNDQPELLEIVVEEGETVEGDDIGIYADNGPVDVENDGTIRGNGTAQGSDEVRPSAGIVIAQPNSTVDNRGEISGAAGGVVTAYFFGEDENDDPLPPQALAENTTVTNSGLIRGEAGVSVALIGGGTVVNSGTIQAFSGDPALGAQAIGVVIAEFPEAIRTDVTGVGSVTNTETGLIEGQLFGVLLSGGGTIDNAGVIRSTGGFNPNFPGVSPFSVIMTASEAQDGRSATLNNSGTVQGILGVLANASLASATINNTGLINGSGVAVFGGLSGDLAVNNGESGTIVSNGVAINSSNGTLALDNAGLVVSNGQSAVEIRTADAQIVNSGTIQGSNHGIVTLAAQPPAVETSVHLAVGTDVVNSGTITGINNDAVRLVGGGTVVNSGTIQGLNPSAGGTDGVSMFAAVDQDPATYEASVANTEDGAIYGDRSGVALSSGGAIENDGQIIGNQVGVIIQNGEAVVDGSITNSGLIVGNSSEGIVAYGNIGTLAVSNSGLILGGGSDGLYANLQGEAQVVVDNLEGGEITGAASGVHVELGNLTLDNAGTIRGDGGNLGFDAPPDAGVTVSGDANTITNSGTISGNRLGITTANYFNAETGQLEGRATDTVVVNSGMITGDNDDGVRLIGGGSVTNSGTISGNVEAFADGISMFAYTDQANEDYGALVTNEAEGEIAGQRFGVILSGGGDVANAGGITGVSGGVFIQGTALNTDPNEDRSGLTASVVNSGTIAGTGDFGGGDGYGLGFGSDMSTATLVNSGTITSEFAEGVGQGSLADLTITNEEGGLIRGGTSGIYGASGGTMTIVNAGTIRGEGTYDGLDAPPDAGVGIATAESSVTNTGTISGAGAGITTAYLFDEELGELVGLAVGTQVTNSGTIAGESNDGVRLIGGGAVANTGTISGAGALGADGVSMFRYEEQAAEDYSASVTNGVDAVITGDRFGIILSGGGAVDNAGTISGEVGGIQIQSQFDGEVAGLAGTLTNSGAIAGVTGSGVKFAAGLDAVVVENSGTITGATTGLTHGTAGTMELTNTGVIAGGMDGVESDADGAVTVVNTGAIAGETGIGFTALTQTTLDNAGVISGGSGLAVSLGGFDDTVILRTGSDIDGAVDAGEGVDSLTLAGQVLELTEEQELGLSLGFESLDVAAGYWNTSGVVGEFGSVTIGEGAALQVNEVDLGEEDGFTSPILTPSVTTNGLLVLNFSENDVVSELDALTIDGTGGLQLIGEAVFTVDTDTLTHTGGTTISNGGLVLTGTLTGNVVTEGDGYFQLGAGGTEGTFGGSIVNDGRFIFNRSDDYDFLGAFSGSGVLDKMGEGVLTFMGDYAFQGVTNIFGGAVRIGGTIDPETEFNLGDGGTLDITGNDQTIGGLEGEEEATVELGEQTLTVAQEENTEFAGAITGLGGIVKDGEGILNLTGDSTYTGPTDVNGGTLAVNGSIVSDVTVNAGGTLGGNGTVGDTDVNGGTLAPGNSIGQLTVDGDLNFAAGSVYEVEVNAAGESDRVDATGEVTIASTASVAVLAEDGDYAPRTDYVILTGAEGVTGTFGSVTTDLAFLDPLLRYGANAVTLSLYRNDVDFTDVAANANQTGVAGAVQALGIDNPLFEAVLVQNASTAQATFGDLSGEILASTITGLTDDSRHLRNAMMGMVSPDEAGMFVWGSAFGGWGDFDGTANAFGMETDHKGFVTGVGFGGEGFGVALSAGLGGSDFDLEGRNDAADVKSKYLAAHATLGAAGGLHGAAGISYAWHDVDTVRTISGAALGQTLGSERDADTLQLFGEIGYDLMMGTTAVTPFARIAHVTTESDAFTENGGNAALVVAKADQETTFLSLGAMARFNAGGEGFQPYLSAAWNHAAGDRAARAASQFDAGGPVFGVVGVAIPKNSAEVEAGLDYTSGTFSIGAAYSGTLAGDRTSHGARVTARITF